MPVIDRCFSAPLRRQVSVLSAVLLFAFALWALTYAGEKPTTRGRRHANRDDDESELEREARDGPPVWSAIAGGVFGGFLISAAALLAAVIVK